MTASIGINLSGNLGERHRCLNALVRDAYQRNLSLTIKDHPQQSGIDRLFTIDLASKQRNLGYIIQTLKDDDMLYVSRALKSFWLLEPEHSKIINPNFLEYELFTQMTLQAVNKMRHWIQMHLREPHRCSEFYQFYKDRDFDIAAKFLWHCSGEYILSEVKNVLEKITPKHLKLLSEKVPQVTKFYFDSLKYNRALLKYYEKNDVKFFTTVKYLLKPAAEVFFYVLENYFVLKFHSYNSVITKYIMKHHKSRFTAKPELYTAWFFNVDGLAECLNEDEIKDLVLKLANAEYLGTWFSYQTVEPLIKRLSASERTVFKKLVFVDKAFGPAVKEWPYPIPDPPVLTFLQSALFDDRVIDKYSPESDFRALLKKRKCAKWRSVTTLLDQLFDLFRFSGYKETLLELRKRLRAESSSQNRQYMFLVLISKTGGRTEDLASLLDLMLEYRNEPVQIRATVVRSLVKRAFIWRLPLEHWVKVLNYGHGLGLYGDPPEAACVEGLHAVVIRDLLADVKPSETVWKAFLEEFSPLAEYSLTADERGCLRSRLSALLLASARSDPFKALDRLHILLDTLTAYHTRFDAFPGTVEAIATADETDFETAKCLLTRVYETGVARKSLIRENFEIVQTDASYVNALRHDISLLDNTTRFGDLIMTEKHSKRNKARRPQNSKKNSSDQFLRKLALYFTEKDGLAEQYRAMLEIRAATTPDKALGRPLALLSSSNFEALLKVFDTWPRKTPQRQLAAALRSNAHVVRPLFYLNSFDWRAAGAKAVANHVATCRQKDVERYLPEALSWGRTLRVALMLAKRVKKEPETFEVFVSKRPGAALTAAMLYFRREGKNLDMRIWEMVKSQISNIGSRATKLGCRQMGRYTTVYIKSAPAVVRAEFFALACKTCKKHLPDMERSIFLRIPAVLPEVKEQFIFEAIDDFLRFRFSDSVEIDSTDYTNLYDINMYIGIIAKFLVLSTSEEMLEERFEKIGIPFLRNLELIWKRVHKENASLDVVDFLDSFLINLVFMRAYFDVHYVSCLPVFERLTKWMHGVLPMEFWFDKYVTVHLTMIHYKTIRLCLKQSPELFSNEARKLKEGPRMLGTIFGKFLAREIEELAEKYFPSITEMYGAQLACYFEQYFYRRQYDDSVEMFTEAVLYGLLANKSVTSCVLARYMFTGLRTRLDSETCVNDLLKAFKQSEIVELRFDLDEEMAV